MPRPRARGGPPLIRAGGAPTGARRAAIRRRLLAWWDAGHRDLPWRFPQHGADPYSVWLAEVMLQQTRVAVVVPYFQRFVARFPTLEALAEATEDEVLSEWSGLGYYARGRRLRAAAREALALHGGLPASVDALLALPGFGRYTAGAVASIAFALPVPCVDGNVARVVSRLFLVNDARRHGGARDRLWELAAALVPAGRPGDFNQALMELGAIVCGRAPRCERCPVDALCLARRAGVEAAVPVARARRAARRLDVACAIVRRGEALLLTRRSGSGLYGGLWELPSAAVPRGGDARATLRRECAASLSLHVVPGAAVASLARVLTHRRLHLTAYECQAAALPPGALLAPPSAWGALAMSTATRRLLELLEGTMSEGAPRPGSSGAAPGPRRASRGTPPQPRAPSPGKPS